MIRGQLSLLKTRVNYMEALGFTACVECIIKNLFITTFISISLAAMNLMRVKMTK